MITAPSSSSTATPSPLGPTRVVRPVRSRTPSAVSMSAMISETSSYSRGATRLVVIMVTSEPKRRNI